MDPTEPEEVTRRRLEVSKHRGRQEAEKGLVRHDLAEYDSNPDLQAFWQGYTETVGEVHMKSSSSSEPKEE